MAAPAVNDPNNPQNNTASATPMNGATQAPMHPSQGPQSGLPGLNGAPVSPMGNNSGIPAPAATPLNGGTGTAAAPTQPPMPQQAQLAGISDGTPKPLATPPVAAGGMAPPIPPSPPAPNSVNQIPAGMNSMQAVGHLQGLRAQNNAQQPAMRQSVWGRYNRKQAQPQAI